MYLSKLWLHNCLLVNVKGRLSYFNIASRPLSEASHSKTKVLVKFGIANIGIVHMASFKAEKACLAASLQTKAFSLVVKLREQ
jgi:hypothetical protein